MSVHVLCSLHTVFLIGLWGGFRYLRAVDLIKYSFKYVREIKLVNRNTSCLKKNYQVSSEGRDLGVYGVSKFFLFFFFFFL